MAPSRYRKPPGGTCSRPAPSPSWPVPRAALLAAGLAGLLHCGPPFQGRDEGPRLSFADSAEGDDEGFSLAEAQPVTLLQQASVLVPKELGKEHHSSGAAPKHNDSLPLLSVNGSGKEQRRRLAVPMIQEEQPPSSPVVSISRKALDRLTKPKNGFSQWLIAVVVALIIVGVLIAAIALTAVVAVQRLLSSTLTEAMVDVMHMTTGLEMELGDSHVSIISGTVEFNGLRIKNLKGFTTEHLLTANKILIDPQIWTYVYSRGETMVINEIILSGVHAHVEYKGEWSHPFHTNFAEILEQMKKHRGEPQTCCPAQSSCLPECLPACPVPSLLTCWPQCLRCDDPPTARMLDPKKSKAKWTNHFQVKRVTLEDITLGIARAKHVEHEPHVEVGRLEYEDFSSKRKLAVAEDVLAELLHMFLTHVVEHLKTSSWLEHLKLRKSASGGRWTRSTSMTSTPSDKTWGLW